MPTKKKPRPKADAESHSDLLEARRILRSMKMQADLADRDAKIGLLGKVAAYQEIVLRLDAEIELLDPADPIAIALQMIADDFEAAIDVCNRLIEKPYVRPLTE